MSNLHSQKVSQRALMIINNYEEKTATCPRVNPFIYGLAYEEEMVGGWVLRRILF